jgi:peptide/nickel transport system substrate-binding protein
MGAASWPGSSLQVRATSPILGERTVSINVAQQTTEQTTTAEPVPEGCLIATAAYGSELASPVQFLRSFRDGQVMKTFAGSSFMEAFNRFYYSFSPIIAGEIAENSALKLPTRLFIYPLIGTLYLSSQIYEIFSVIPEVAVVMAGFSASIMIGAVYLFPVFLLVSFFIKEKRHGIKKPCKWIVLVSICGFLTIVIGEAVSSRNLAMMGSALFVITLILISGIGMIKISNYTLNRLSHR